MERNYRYIVSLAAIVVLTGITLVMIIQSNRGERRKASESNVEEETVTEISMEITTFQVGEGWGYDIFIDGKVYIHQPMIPAVQGISEFETEAKARKTAEFVVDKIKRNIIPPTVSYKELDSLGIFN
ncbi:MAG: DUF4907 domain-containing protein [Bacteroidales bacterium]|nr:MAG: DUF4907 domain-containing protein [Bacteroidales bacterium]